jgi:hypothetical protein
MSRPEWNVVRDGADACAEVIKLRLIGSGYKKMDVTVDDEGFMRSDRVEDNKRLKDLPAHWLVGRYTRSALCVDIETDLRMRLMELPA